MKTCPKCGIEYSQPSAISREDNKTEICPKCGVEEAMRAFYKKKGVEDNA